MSMLALLGLLPDGAVVEGSVRFGEHDLLRMPRRRLRAVAGRELAMVFQDPLTSLHPMLSVGRQLTEHVRRHLGLSRHEAEQQALASLEDVRIPHPASALRAFPHQFSGGMRQRIAIAIALACKPKLLIADEPTTALDVTVQAGILRLLRDLTDDLGLAVLLVTHDLGVMSALADTVAVMRDGRVVEHGSRYQVIREPKTEYARELIASLPHTPPPGAGVEEQSPHPAAGVEGTDEP
jgi:ABC-type dipeptide/oligopeptide/nickel transport system ATPase component